MLGLSCRNEHTCSSHNHFNMGINKRLKHKGHLRRFTKRKGFIQSKRGISVSHGGEVWWSMPEVVVNQWSWEQGWSVSIAHIEGDTGSNERKIALGLEAVAKKEFVILPRTIFLVTDRPLRYSLIALNRIVGCTFAQCGGELTWRSYPPSLTYDASSRGWRRKHPSVCCSNCRESSSVRENWADGQIVWKFCTRDTGQGTNRWVPHTFPPCHIRGGRPLKSRSIRER